MNKEEVTMIGFELVAYAGEAKSNLLEALKLAKQGQFDKAEKLTAEAEKLIVNAHRTQTDLLAKEAGGDSAELSFIMVHGQDHLMTTILLKDLMEHLIELYKRS